MGDNQFKTGGVKWGQYLNLAGVKYFGRTLLRNRGAFVPHLRCRSIAQVNFEVLRQNRGVKYLVFDKDNTLTLPYERELHPSVSSTVDRLKELYGPEKIAILSNSVGSGEDLGGREAAEVEAILGLRVIRHARKKPEVGDDILRHFGID